MKFTLNQFKLKGNVKSILYKNFNVELKSNNKYKIIEDSEDYYMAFNKEGLIIRSKGYGEYREFKYSSDKKKCIATEYNQTHKVMEINKYVFNNNMDVLQCLRYSSNKNYLSDRTYRYNKKGNLIHEIHYNSAGDLDGYVLYEYKGSSSVQTIKKVTCEEGLEEIRNYRYSLNKDFTEDIAEIEIIDLFDGVKTVSYIKYKYDADRILISKKWLDESNFVTNYYDLKLLFDNRNNWIKKIAYRQGKQVWFEERKIEYYLGL